MRGQDKSQTVGNVHCFVWKDKKNIDYVQTICNPSETGTVIRKNREASRTAVSCPLPVKIYNEKMEGVNLLSQVQEVVAQTFLFLLGRWCSERAHS